MANDFSSPNPYQAPSAASFHIDPNTQSSNQLVLKKFRSQVHALGGLWIFFGVMGGVGAIIMIAMMATNGFGNAQRFAEMQGYITVLTGILGIASLAWTTIGVFACFKKLPAIYTGLVLCYLSLVGNLLNINICAVVILIVAIIQAHRVISMAGELRKLGIPLNAKPSI